MTTAARKGPSGKAGPRRATERPKVDDGGTRQRLVQATAEIMHDEGYAAATSRRVATKAGVKQALVYYYFPTMDDLFLAVLRSGAEAALEQLRTVLTEEDPIRALWRINSDPRQTVMSTELMALANHRKVIGAELRHFAERVRDIETAAVTMSLRSYGVDLEAYPPVVISMLVAQIARSVGNETAVGLTHGHDELEHFIEAQFALLAKGNH
ncbi:TetR/AcrR family transcriptional regulator [Mycolicibacterium rhodesiae]|uniref:TetR family transcriptional regulator n=1 Tax=Mycolicibacterium rhodesiae TaxID=36814 RepID=A0A1X0IPV3_MYCRH|nr:TetR/AcrR family transcriptional regulator [Mycolicibacterium rhodesiae]ORB50415.1 TetR family transcriptional regulator [Mycolicibacterium rhodesiae]